MAQIRIKGARIAGVCTSVPSKRFDNLQDTVEFSQEEVRKVVGMAGVAARRVVDGTTCSTDLCFAAADTLIKTLNWDRETIDGLILVTQTPDYFMPSSSCLLHQRLGLSNHCASFDVNLGCSGYVYGLWLAAMMLSTASCRRVLLLHGETPTLYADKADRSVSLLFGDAGSATLLEAPSPGTDQDWYFVLNTDGKGFKDLIIEGGGFRNRFCADQRANYVTMNGSNVFNFTISVLPPLIRETLLLAGNSVEDIDYYIFHQSNQFILKHIMNKTGLPPEKVPIILKEFGNTGGPSVPLTLTQGSLIRPARRPLKLMLLGYGVGLSWGSALLQLDQEATFCHVVLP